MACLWGHFHDGLGFVKASVLVSSLWLCKSEFCPDLDLLAKILQLTHEPISDKCQQPAMGAQTGGRGCTMAADLALVRCVVWGLLTQNSHGRALRYALPCRANTVHICHRVLLLGLHSIFSLGLPVFPMLPTTRKLEKTRFSIHFCNLPCPPCPLFLFYF